MFRSITLFICLALSAQAVPVATVLGQNGPCVSGAFSQAPPEVVAERSGALAALSAIVERYVQEEAIVGAEFLVLERGHVLLHEAFGWRDREDSIPMLPNTIFNIRSMTKPLVGAAAQILIDDGVLALEQPVAELLPGFDNDASRAITVEQLLTHRSGLPLTVVQGLNDYPDLIALGNAVGERGPEFEPGSRFSYSDAGSDALGAVVEVASGIPLEEFIESRLLEPLGMEDTFGSLDTLDPRAHRMASLYLGNPGNWIRNWKPTGESMYPFVWGSQGFYSTPADYARFVSMWMNDGVCGNGRILSGEAITRTLTPRSVLLAMGNDFRQPTNFPGLETWYGQMAVLHIPAGVGERSDPVVIGHSGSDGTIVWAWPDRDLIVLYFTQSRGTLSHLRLERALEWLLISPESHPEPPDPNRLTPFLGEYMADSGPFLGGRFKVFEQDGFLTIEMPGHIENEFRDPTPDGSWASVLIDGVSVTFEREESGEVTAMNWLDGESLFVLPRAAIAAEELVDVELLSRYIGRYRDPEAGQDVEVVIHEGGLGVRVPGAGLVELDGPDGEGFFRVSLNPVVRISFDLGPEGEVVSYTVHAPDGRTFVRPRITEMEGPVGRHHLDSLEMSR